MNICLFTETEIKNPLPLKDERAEHIIKILHKKEGDTFTAGIIGGMAGTAEIKKITDSIYFDFKPESNGKLLSNLSMIIGFPRPIQLKRLLRDIAALGIKEVHLTGTELGEKSYMKSNLSEKENVYKMLLDGTVQAGSTRVPEVFIHQTLKACLESILKSKTGEDSVKMTLDNIKPETDLTTFMKNNGGHINYIAAIGSERGWTDKERQLLDENGFTKLGMGNRIMRTETAATVSASIILSLTNQLK